MLLKCLLATLTLAPSSGLPYGSTGATYMVSNHSYNMSFGYVFPSYAFNPGETSNFQIFNPLGLNFVFDENNDVNGYEVYDSFDNSSNMYRLVSNVKFLWIDAGSSLQQLQVNCYFSFVPNLDFINSNLTEIQINNLKYITTYCNSFFYENRSSGMNVIKVDTDTQHFVDSSLSLGVSQLFTTSSFNIPETFSYLGINCDICFDYTDTDAIFNDGFDEGFNQGENQGFNEKFNVWDWLIISVGSFLDFEIFPHFSLSTLLLWVIGGFIVMYILRLLIGG